MNSILKGLLGAALVGGAFYWGVEQKHNKAMEDLDRQTENSLSLAAASRKNLEVLQARFATVSKETTLGSDLETEHLQNLEVIGEEQKQIDALMGKWPAADQERAAAVKAVREKETKRPPASLVLADGTKLERFVFKAVADETTVSAEHSNGIAKLSPSQLPADYRERLGLGWKVDPPAALKLDRDGNPVSQGAAPADAGEELDLAALDMGSILGLTQSISLVDSHLKSVNAALKAEQAKLRKLTMYKSELVEPASGKTYKTLKEECNAKLSRMAERVIELKDAKTGMEKKLKSL